MTEVSDAEVVPYGEGAGEAYGRGVTVNVTNSGIKWWEIVQVKAPFELNLAQLSILVRRG